MLNRSVLAAFILVLTVLAAGCVRDGRDPVAERVGVLKDELAAAAVGFPDEPLTLAAAIDTALVNNLSIRAAEFEYAIAHEVASYSTLKTLPSLQANLDLSTRNKYNASSSRSLETGTESLEPSFSSEKFGRPSNLTVAWSLLDLGLGVIRSRQAGERERIAGENLRRLRQQIALETAVAYARLRAAEEIQECVASLEEAIKLQLRFNSQSGQDGSIAKAEAARRAGPLLNGLKMLADLRKDTESARGALAKAMGVTRPGPVRFDHSGDWLDEIPVPASLPREALPDALYETALANRPEMYNADSDAAVSRDEAKAALLQMAPNVRLRGAVYNNPDRYLVYQNWVEAAVQVSWDLLRFPLLHKEAKTARARADLTALRRNMTAASILVQVNLALMDLVSVRERLDLCQQIEANRRIILEGAEAGAISGKGNRTDVLGERLRHVSDFAAMAWARSDFLAARARLLSALGIDFYDMDWHLRVDGSVPLERRRVVPTYDAARPAAEVLQAAASDR
ncbi:MAG: TolC family protein, partial [Planctomycetaceae bacterium]|nr:TolC family protein [Planctomycetaceae bacterium]